MKNFEKNIKNRAGSFQLDPMSGSFDKVMEALKKKKKKRFILWLWLVIPGILIGCSGIFISRYYSTNHTPFVATSSNTHSQNGTKQTHRTNHFSSQKPFAKKTKPVVLPQTNAISQKDNTPNYIRSQSYVRNNHSHTNISNKQNTRIVFLNSQNEEDIIQEDRKALVRNSNAKEPEFVVSALNNPYTFLPFVSNPLFPSRKNVPLSNANEPVIKEKLSQWSLGIYSELGASRSLFINNKDSFGYAKSRETTDKFLFSYSAGIQFRYSPVKFLAIETGIGFTHYESNQIISNGGSTGSSITSNSDPDTVYTLFAVNANSKEYRNVYNYISIPLKLYYQKKWKWTGMEAGGGVVFDIPVHTNSYAADENTGLSYLRKDMKDSRLNLFGIQASANIHLVFHAKRYSFFAGPVFKYRLNSMFDEDYIIRQHYYFIGAEMGMRYNF